MDKQEKQTHVTRTARIWLDGDGIIRKVFLDGAEETLKDALESAEIIKLLCQGKKRPMLVDFTKVRSMDAEARAYYAGPAGPLITAVGGITSSMLSKVIGNFFMGFNRPPTPGKLFTSEKDAVAWLKNYQ